MRPRLVVLCVVLAAVGCKKGSSTGGGGGAWLVGSAGLMENVDEHGVLGGYELGAAEELAGIACRYDAEAWVVGAHGTLLYTSDAGATWTAQAVPAMGDLRAIATQDAGPVFVGGDGVLMTSNDTGATWTTLATASFRAIAAAQEGSGVLALASDGQLWSYAGGALTMLGAHPGARAVALDPDGTVAMLAGAGLARSSDGGQHWTDLAVDPSLTFDDVRIADDGSAVAVGAGGAIATIATTGAVAIQHVGTADLHTLHIADADATDTIGYAGGEAGQVLVTLDSGQTWTVGPNVGRTVRGIDEIGFGHR